MQPAKCSIRGRRIHYPLEGLKGKKRSGFIFLSGRMCNYDCPHCLTDSGTNRREFAKPSTIVNILNNIKPLMKNESVFFTAISGGEPFLNLDFLEESINRIMKISQQCSVPVPKIPIVTNGTISGIEIFKILEPVKEKVLIYYSPDEFHPRPSGIPMFERYGFIVDSPGKGRKIAALGRAYGMENYHDWKMDCTAAGKTYEISEGSARVSKTYIPSTSKFMVLENGDIKLCAWGGITFGNLANESVFDIAERLEKDEPALALMENGPLGMAEVMGKLEAAVEILRIKGSCGVCHALKENLI